MVFLVVALFVVRIACNDKWVIANPLGGSNLAPQVHISYCQRPKVATSFAMLIPGNDNVFFKSCDKCKRMTIQLTIFISIFILWRGKFGSEQRNV